MTAPSQQPVVRRRVLHIFAEDDLVLFGAIGFDGRLGARPDSDAVNDRYRSLLLPPPLICQHAA